MATGCYCCRDLQDDVDKDIEAAINGNLKRILCDECFEDWDGTRESFLEAILRGDNPWLLQMDLTQEEFDDRTGCK